ncbi:MULTISPECIES: DNA-processing protein DprA [Streptomyces]|uniref:DNA-processing protein DprA n=1 Tax=Streptomyces evansiae TaxID=3075535 RepID=A0ABU2R990_9ACTN|nr:MULTISPECIES: DNA-processing protein DprA [unclassified Streptomyces]EFK97977.1 DNA protecting protein DprA [Streptomyces sp. SPB78]MDT0412654.1 DNA-processing protein DprA [Streptomyces sp. DSM 41979]SCD86311.1 DNA processing protein [Streptomyces sp. DfronAA-171]
MIGNLPPFLFYCGELEERDARSIAVVGTRQASENGLRRAARMARELVEHNVTIASGLAKGIDASAHQATLTAGGRTFAVMGTGIAASIYPAENRPLAKAILSAGGALLSQFWPTSPPGEIHLPAPQRGHLRHHAGKRRHRGIQHIGRQDAGLKFPHDPGHVIVMPRGCAAAAAWSRPG